MCKSGERIMVHWYEVARGQRRLTGKERR